MFLPLETVTSRKNGRFRVTKRPLFPGYVFVAADATESPWRAINSTTGITKLVSFGAAPARVPSDLVAALQAACDNNGEFAPQPAFETGQEVTVTGGPFADFVASVHSLAAKQRVWVLLDLMGSKTLVSLPQDHLRRT